MIVYDAGALIAAERGERPMLALHTRMLQRRLRPVVPAAVLAQVWRGGPQASLSRVWSAVRQVQDRLGVTQPGAPQTFGPQRLARRRPSAWAAGSSR